MALLHIPISLLLFIPFTHSHFKGYSEYPAEIFTDNWNCCAFPIFAEFILKAWSENERQVTLPWTFVGRSAWCQKWSEKIVWRYFYGWSISVFWLTMFLFKTVSGWNTTFSEGTSASKKKDSCWKDWDAKWSSILQLKSSNAFPKIEIFSGDIKRTSKDISVRKRISVI